MLTISFFDFVGFPFSCLFFYYCVPICFLLFSFPQPPVANMSRENLVARLNLVKRILPRAHLFRMRGVLITEYTNDRLQESLLHYREAVHGSNACTTRAQYEDRLVAALLKDTNGQKGNGYDHGQRFMSVEEEIEEMDISCLQEMLEDRGVLEISNDFELLQKRVTDLLEEEHEELLESAVQYVLENELKTRSFPFEKKTMIIWIQKKILEMEEKEEEEEERRRRRKFSSSGGGGRGGAKNLSVPPSPPPAAAAALAVAIVVSGRKRRRSDDAEEEVMEEVMEEEEEEEEEEEGKDVVARRRLSPERNGTNGTNGTPRPSKRRRVEVLSSPSADQQLNGVTIGSPSASSSSSPAAAAAGGGGAVVPVAPPPPFSQHFPLVTNWKRLSVKQLQLEILLGCFDHQIISFDVSWNDIPSYHTHFAFGNGGGVGGGGGGVGGGGGGGSGTEVEGERGGNDKPWCSMM